MLKDLSPGQKALADYISELSEEAYSAGWMEGVEFTLWTAVIGDQRSFGRLQITEKMLQRLKDLSADCKGWIYFDESNEESFLLIEQWKKKFREESNNFTHN